MKQKEKNLQPEAKQADKPLSVNALAETLSMEAITVSESSRLMELEGKIKTGLTTFVEVGEALLEIRYARLYRSDFGTFEEYCKQKWGISASRARQLIGASEVSANIGSVTRVTLPTTEKQTRPLTQLEQEQQPKAWERAVEIAGGEQPTAKQVQAAVDEIVRPQPAPERHQLPKHLFSVGMKIAGNAIRMLETIGRNDRTRREAFEAVIKFCQQELAKPNR